MYYTKYLPFKISNNFDLHRRKDTDPHLVPLLISSKNLIAKRFHNQNKFNAQMGKGNRIS